MDYCFRSKEISREFVKMKDLVIAGKVWLDMDKNGLIKDENSGE